jgi:hypothetical protein
MRIVKLSVAVLACLVLITLLPGCGKTSATASDNFMESPPSSRLDIQLKMDQTPPLGIPAELPGCGKTSTTTSDNFMESPPSSPSSGLDIQLKMAQAPPLGTPADLVWTVKQSSQHSLKNNTTANITLPEGTALISGNLTWTGHLEPGQSLSFITSIVFTTVGRKTIEGEVFNHIDEHNTLGDGDCLYLHIHTDKSRFGRDPEPPLLQFVQEKYSKIQVQLEISHAPRLNEPADIYFSILSPDDFPNMAVEIVFDKSGEVLEGNKIQTLDLKAGIPVHLTAKIAFTETGFQTVTVYFYQSTDKFSNAVPHDAVYLNIGVDESVFDFIPIDYSTLPVPPAITTDRPRQ